MQDTVADDREPTTYEPPRLVQLGTLADLTQGSDFGEEDGFDGFSNSTGPT